MSVLLQKRRNLKLKKNQAGRKFPITLIKSLSIVEHICRQINEIEKVDLK